MRPFAPKCAGLKRKDAFNQSLFVKMSNLMSESHTECSNHILLQVANPKARHMGGFKIALKNACSLHSQAYSVRKESSWGHGLCRLFCAK